nr:MFS transporter [Sphingopyxis sp.]
MNHRNQRFVGAYALANLGAFLFFIPLIGLSLPQRMTDFVPADPLRWLSWALLLGALVASGANIAGGAMSDWWFARHHSRRRVMQVGLTLTLVSYAGLAVADSPGQLIAAFLFFQLCFNLLFAPLAALATDYVPDHEKGRVFGVLSLALPLSQAAIALLVMANVQTFPQQLALTGAVATLCILPMLCASPPPLIVKAVDSGLAGGADAPMSRDFRLAWFARMLMQCASVAIGSYLFLHLAATVGRNPDLGSAELWVGRFALIASAAGLFTGIILGVASDRAQRRRIFLWPTALATASGCGLLALSADPVFMPVGYALFAFGLAGFLTVDGAMVAQLVGNAPNRAVALGVMNLTNTLSSVLVPAG